MDILSSIKLRLKQNEEIAKKFHKIEIDILSILNFQDLCVTLLTKISEEFSIPFIWLTIIEENPVSEYIKSINNSDILISKTRFISSKLFFRTTKIKIYDNTITFNSYPPPLLINNNIDQFSQLYPKNFEDKIASLTILPIVLNNKMLGSLNLGDLDPKRFEPGIDTSLLEQLAVKISLCFSNVTAHEKLKFLAFHDPLTGLLNRRVMDRILHREYDRAKRYYSDLCVVFFDLDNFKKINDVHGHDIGDKALIIVAEIFKKLQRVSDITARFAGDEFVVILPLTTIKQAEDFVLRVQKELLNNQLKFKDQNNIQQSITIQTSYGVSSLKENNCADPSELLKNADSKLYIMKANKKREP